MDNLSVAESIFFAALDKSAPEQRAAYLDEACGTDQELRRCVERLLQAQPNVGAFLQAPAAGLARTVDEPPIAERPGTVIGPYKLLEQIGEGGMGVVFLAEQTEPVRRKVALKIIKPGMDSAQVIARFEAERQALAMMDHPNIAKVLDAGTTASEPEVLARDSAATLAHASGSEGRPYFVMELVKGTPITDFCDQNRLTPRERLELFVPVCQAIQHAHQKGIIHRDIKPSNVLVTLYDGKPVPKVIDFGIAKATDQRLTEKTLFTRHGQIVGTFEYMSPEQATLDALDVDTRSDIYSLGVLLYELLTGSTPLDKERLRQAAFGEILRLIREEEPPRPSNRLSTSGGLPMIAAHRKTEAQRLPRLVRGDLDWIVMKGLDKDRTRRYETASALAADVRRYLSEEPIEARPPSVGYRLRKFVKRHRGPVSAAAAVLLVAVAALAASTLLIGGAYESEARYRKAAETAAREAETAADHERRMAAETREKQRHTAGLLARHQLDQGLKRLNEGDSEGLLDLLEARETADELPELREPIGQLWAVAHHRWEGCLVHVLPQGWHVVFSPDSRLLADLSRDAGVVRLIETDTGRPHVPDIPVPKNVGAVVFSPDGRYLATHSLQEGGRLWDTTTGQPLGEPLRHDRVGEGFIPQSQRYAAAFSPDGNLLATGGQDGTVRLWEVPTGRPHGEPLRHKRQVNVVAFSPDGKWLASGTYHDGSRLWEVATGQPRGDPLDPGAWVSTMLFTADSRQLITVETERGIKVWETETGQFRKSLTTDWITHACLSPDGKLLAGGDVGWKVHLWSVETGAVLGEPLPHTARIADVVFSPDGNRLAVTTQDEVTRIWQLGRRTPACSVLPAVGWEHRATWSADGRFLATSGGAARLWRLGPTAPQPLPNPGVPALSFRTALSPDGKRLAGAAPNGVVRLWDPRPGDPIDLPIRGVTALAFNPDGTRLAAGSQDWSVRICEADGKPGPLISCSTWPQGLSWNPDGTRLAVATPGAGVVTEFDTATGQQAGLPFPHGDWVWAASYSPDGSLLATLGGDESASKIRLWSTRLGPKQLPVVLDDRLGGGGWASHARVSFSRDGRLLFVQSPKADTVLLRLPSAPPELREMRLRTWVTLGARRDANGVVQPIPAEEWARLREELAALDLQRQPSHWAALEAAFTDELLSRAIAAHLALGNALRDQKDVKEARREYQQAIRIIPPRSADPKHYFLLAMAHWQLGEKEQARAWYNMGMEWMEKNKSRDEALRRCQAEAAALLSAEQKKD